MFEQIARTVQDDRGKIKYVKELGWNEFDEDGDKVDTRIIVRDVDWGHNVYRYGKECEVLYWSRSLGKAVEWAVDRAREEIADHEIKQQKRQIEAD